MLKDELRHTHFPYCLEQQQDGTHVVLNRNYKPIGFMTGALVNYDAYPIGVKIAGLNPKTAAKLDCKGRDGLERIYLYNDGCIPTENADNMKAYTARLAILMALRIQSED